MTGRLVGVDVGGTFTDVMAIDGGKVVASKIPTDVHSSEISVLQGAEEVGVLMTAAGGGWGDPWTRDPALVLRDVRDEYVTIDGAARDYGVLVVGDLDHPEQMRVDEDATAALRSSRG